MSAGMLGWIALGGAAGAVSRYLLVAWVTTWLPHRFPYGTLCVNVLGSFLLGCAFVMVVERMGGHAAWRAVFMTGFLGAFTTFSTFSLENYSLLVSGHWGHLLTYVLASVLGGLLCVAAGIWLTRMWLLPASSV